MNGFWPPVDHGNTHTLTAVFGATGIGFIASGTATWYCDSGLARVLTWTLGATGVPAAVLILARRDRLRD